MTMRLLMGLLLAAFALGGPVAAEPTPALPFWSRPFPAGFVARRPFDGWSDRDGGPERCIVRTADGRRVVSRRLCRPALRMMD